MDGAIVIALGFALAIIVLAIFLTRLAPRRKRRRDVNGSPTDGRASATWIGINAARGDDRVDGD